MLYLTHKGNYSNKVHIHCGLLLVFMEICIAHGILIEKRIGWPKTYLQIWISL